MALKRKLSYVKRVASAGSMHDTGCSGLVHWDDPEGWDGREVGGGFRMGNTCTLMVDSSQCMAKPIKKKKKKKRHLFFGVSSRRSCRSSQNH